MAVVLEAVDVQVVGQVGLVVGVVELPLALTLTLAVQLPSGWHSLTLVSGRAGTTLLVIESWSREELALELSAQRMTAQLSTGWCDDGCRRSSSTGGIESSGGHVRS